MKRLFSVLLGKPRIVLPVVLVLAGIITAALYSSIGRPPVVTLSDSVATSTNDTIPPNNVVDLSFLKAGKVTKVNVSVGSKVKKGDVLASLDTADVEAQLAQAKGALELAQAQYGSLNVQYANTKKQQDTLVENAYRTLLSSDLAAVAHNSDTTYAGGTVDNSQAPQVTGTYTCDKEGSYKIDPYQSGYTTGYSFTYSGLESGRGNLTYYTPQPLGSCGLSIQFPAGYTANNIEWVIAIPNIQSSNYVTNKNAYDLAVATRDQVLNQLANSSSDTGTAKAAIDAAEGTYQAAQAAYQNSLIIAPADGVVESIDSTLKPGQTVSANKALITIQTQ